MNPRLQMMVESREVEPFAAPDEEVAARWRRAVRSYADSRKGLSVESMVTLCYQAGLQAATAIVRAAGYRVRTSASGHHRLTFEALRGLGIEEVSPLGREINALRRERHHAVYEWDAGEDEAAGLDPGALDAVVRKLLTHGHAWLAEQRPGVARELEPLPEP